MSFGSARARQLEALLMRRWEHFSSRLAPHFPMMGLRGCARCIVGAGGGGGADHELGQVSATLDSFPRSWHQLAPPMAPSGRSALPLLLLLLLPRLSADTKEEVGRWGHVKGSPGTSSLTGHPCHDMTRPLGGLLPAVRGCGSDVVQTGSRRP